MRNGRIETYLFIFLAACIFGCNRLAPPPSEITYRDFVLDFNSGIPSDVQFIKFGTPESIPFLVSGWGAPESSSKNETFAYAVGLESSLRFWVNKPTDLHIAFGAHALDYPDAPELPVEIFVNGRQIKNLSLGAGLRSTVINIKSETQLVGENILTFKFAWAKSPSEVIPGSADDRQLAAYFEYAVIYRTELQVQRFIQHGIWLKDISWSDSIRAPAIGMPAGNGIRFPNIPIAKNARLQFAFASTGSKEQSSAFMEVLFKPEDEDIISLWKAQVKSDQVKPTKVDLDLARIGRKRGDLIFRVEEIDEIGPANFAWIRPELKSRRPNVLLIVADALRADRLKCYGGPVDTPNIDALARDGALFENAFSHYPGTPPSFSTIFTGKIPPHHGVRTMSDPLSTGEYTIAEALTGLIDHRGGFVALNILPTNMGFAQGFTQYDLNRFNGWYRDGEAVNDEVFTWLRENAQKGFFAFVHYADTHSPYAAPGSFDARVKGFVDNRMVFDQRVDRPRTLEFPIEAPPGEHELAISVEFPANCELKDGGQSPFALTSIEGSVYSLLDEPDTRKLENGLWIAPGKPSTAILRNLGISNASTTIRFFVNVEGGGQNGCPGGDMVTAYNREVAFLDRQVGKLIELLKTAGVYDNTLIIFTADHGEAFSEHGAFGHIDGLYDEFLRVPLIVRAPWAVPKGKLISGQVGLMDIAPTIMDICGLPEFTGADGTSLVEIARGKKSDRPLFSETVLSATNVHLLAVRAPKWKLIRSEDGKRIEIYDLANDPGERRNLVANRPDQARILTEALDKIVRSKTSVSQKEVPDDVKARLRAMGYIK